MSSPLTASLHCDWLAQHSSLLWLADWRGGKAALGNTSPPTPGQLQFANIHHPKMEQASEQCFRGREWFKFCTSGPMKSVFLVQKETWGHSFWLVNEKRLNLVEVITWESRSLKLSRKICAYSVLMPLAEWRWWQSSPQWTRGMRTWSTMLRWISMELALPPAPGASWSIWTCSFTCFSPPAIGRWGFLMWKTEPRV